MRLKQLKKVAPPKRRNPKCKQWPRCSCVLQGRESDCRPTFNTYIRYAANALGG